MTDAELSFEIRGMLDADVEAAVGLSSNAGWNQTSADWLRLLAYQTDGCFVA